MVNLMKLADVVISRGIENLAKNTADTERAGLWDSGFKYIFRACHTYPYLSPNLSGTSKEEVLRKWIRKYKKASEARISRRISNPPGTVADPIIDTIINARFPKISNQSLRHIKFAHRLSMSAENILGLLLEEFLAEQLIRLKWHCAWGESIRSVDFCSEDIHLLQVKNRSNSENSSSSRVRLGTDIIKWFRVNATTGAYMWDGLNKRLGVDIFSEDAFKSFVRKALQKNPAALAVEQDNPWKNA